MRSYSGLALSMLLGLALPALAEQRLRLATTTSTENTGLLVALNRPFEALHGVKVHVIPVGTGKALRLGENGDVDLVLVHAPAAEKAFVQAGFGVRRLPVMHNDFVLLGPLTEPAGVTAAADITSAMSNIAHHEITFVSRGDDSGTHKKELSLWEAAGVKPSGEWYLSAGQGMGATLRITHEKQAYALTDRATYLAYQQQLDLKIVFEGAPAFFNPYHAILVNPARHPHVKTGLATKYVDFIRGEHGQQIIRDFRMAGEQLFHPDVIK